MPGVVTGHCQPRAQPDIPTLSSPTGLTWMENGKYSQNVTFITRTESPPFRGIVSRTVAGWLRAFHDIVTPTLCTNQSPGWRETDQWGTGEELSAGDGQGHGAPIVPSALVTPRLTGRCSKF